MVIKLSDRSPQGDSCACQGESAKAHSAKYHSAKLIRARMLPRGVGQSSLGQISLGKAHSVEVHSARPLGFGLSHSAEAFKQSAKGHSAISVGLGQIDPEKDHSDSATPLELGHSRMTRLSFVLGHSRMTRLSFVLGHSRMTRPSLVLGHSRMTRPSLVLGHVYSAKVTSSSFGPGGFGGPFSVGQADSAKVTRPNRSKDEFIRPHYSDSARMIRPSSRTRPG